MERSGNSHLPRRRAQMQHVMHNYLETWQQFVLQGTINDDMLPPSLIQSWRRCASHRVDPYNFRTTEPLAIPLQKLTNMTTQIPHALLLLLRPSMEDLHQFAEGSECVVVFADTNTCIVDIVGDQFMQQELEHLGLSI